MLIHRKSLLASILVLRFFATPGAAADPDIRCGLHQLKACSVQELESLGVNVHINIDKLDHNYPVVFQGGHAKRLYRVDDKELFHEQKYPELRGNIYDYALQGLSFCSIQIYTKRFGSIKGSTLNSFTNWVVIFSSSKKVGDDKNGGRIFAVILEATDVAIGEAPLAKLACSIPDQIGSSYNSYDVVSTDTELMQNDLGNYIEFIEGGQQNE